MKQNTTTTGEHYMTLLQDARKLAEYAAESPDGPYAKRWADKSAAKLAAGVARRAEVVADRAARGKAPLNTASSEWVVVEAEKALASYAAYYG